MLADHSYCYDVHICICNITDYPKYLAMKDYSGDNKLHSYHSASVKVDLLLSLSGIHTCIHIYILCTYSTIYIHHVNTFVIHV